MKLSAEFQWKRVRRPTRIN